LRNFNEATATKFEWNWIDIRKSDDHAVASVTLSIHLKYKEDNLIVPIRWTICFKTRK